MFGTERHHIVFRSQGGLDFDMNYIYLSPEDHRGNYGPHLCKQRDLILKQQLELDLRQALPAESYTVDELIQLLGLDGKQAHKAFKHLQGIGGIQKEDAIFRLMGSRFYL